MGDINDLRTRLIDDRFISDWSLFLLGLMVGMLLMASCATAEDPSVLPTFDMTAMDQQTNDRSNNSPDLYQGPIASPPDLATYNPCVYIEQRPLLHGSHQAILCLYENVCVGSDGQTYVRDYYDNCHDLFCWWKLACNYNDRGIAEPQVYCLPNNEQSNPEYADDACSDPIAMVAVGQNGKPFSKYVCLDSLYSPNTNDVCVNAYTITRPFQGGGNVYYLANGLCNGTYLLLPNLPYYYFSKTPVDPATLFVPQ